LRPVRRSVLRAAIVASSWLAAVALPAACLAQEELLQELKKVSAVKVEGNRHLSDGALKKVMKTRGPSFWPWGDTPVLRYDFLRSDLISIRQLYTRYGYLDARAEFQVDAGKRPDKVAVTFRIVEGRPSRIRDVRLTGMHAFGERELARRLWAKVGKPFDPAYLQLDTLRLSELYEEKGYRPHVLAEAWRDSIDSLRVSVRYGIDEGVRYRFGQVTITGRQNVNERLVRRELVTPAGATYQRSRVIRSQERLYDSGLFSQVQIEPLPDSTRTIMDLALRLRERRPRWLDAGVGSGTEERFRLTSEWGHRNVLGRGLQAVATTRLSYYADPEQFARFQRFHVEGSLLDPWLLRSRTRGQVTPYYERYHDRNKDRPWVVRQYFEGVNFVLRRELNRFTRVNLAQENLYARQRFELTEPALVDSATRDSLQNVVVPKYTTHRLALGFERDTRDNPFRTGRGSALVTSIEVAGGPLSGTSSFRKAQLAASWYTPFREGWVFASHFVGGVVQPFGPTPQFSPSSVVDREVARVPLEDRFRIGGVNSLRFYDENAIPPAGSGGLALLQGNLELRVPTPVRLPFLGPVGIEAYLDAGNVWARREYIRWSQLASGSDESDPNLLRYVVGFGPRVDLPVGPLRLDVSWRVRPTPSHAKLQFAIGPSF
jgi:outer membrane protein assembly complex protein YaeT